MQIQIESTDQLTELDGVPCRVWNGTTAAGVPCLVFVHRIAVSNDENQQQFDAELRQVPVGRPVTLGEVLGGSR